MVSFFLWSFFFTENNRLKVGVYFRVYFILIGAEINRDVFNFVTLTQDASARGNLHIRILPEIAAYCALILEAIMTWLFQKLLYNILAASYDFLMISIHIRKFCMS